MGRIYVLDGPIAIGKSTALSALQELQYGKEDPIRIFFEPTYIWREFGSRDLLAMAYNAKRENRCDGSFFRLQSVIIHTMLKRHIQAMALLDRYDCDIVMERSVSSARIFVKANRDLMTQDEFEILMFSLGQLDELEKGFKKIFFCCLPPAKLYERVQRRGRGFETGLDEEYFIEVAKLYKAEAVNKADVIFNESFADASPLDIAMVMESGIRGKRYAKYDRPNDE